MNIIKSHCIKELKNKANTSIVNEKELYSKDIELIEKFKESIIKKNFTELDKLLVNQSNYDIQNNDKETKCVGKYEFIEWIEKQLALINIETVEMDQCLFCKVGNPVLLFNGGIFPRELKNHGEFAKTGLMLEFENDFISGITFCYTFLRNENKSMFQSNLDKIKELEERGMSSKEAFKAILGFDRDDDIF
jgi:hypothetical protein